MRAGVLSALYFITLILIGAAAFSAPYSLLSFAFLTAAAALLFGIRMLHRQERKNFSALMSEYAGLVDKNPEQAIAELAVVQNKDPRVTAMLAGLTRLAEARLESAAAMAEAETRCVAFARGLEQEKRRSADLAEQLNKFKDLLGKVAEQTQSITVNLSGQLRNLSQMVSEVGEGVEIQRFRLADTSGSMERILDSVIDVSRSVHTASEQAQSSRLKAQTGSEEVAGAVGEIENVKQATLNLRDAMSLLVEKSENISNVMSVINEVADQTNLLSLNAAIEAARAGEAGRGFSVVADEVRKLAEKTMAATKEVADAVKDIQQASHQNMNAVTDAAGSIVHGAEKAAAAGGFMSEIVTDMDSTAEHLSSIVAATEEQSQSSGVTTRALDEISQVALRTAERMQSFTSALVQISAGMEELDIMAAALSNGDSLAEYPSRIVEWSRDLDTGIELIDSQHKMLCAYINSIYRAVIYQRDPGVINDIVSCLKDYTVNHFNTEEQYFTHSGYPEHEKHIKVHHSFVDKVADTERKLRSGHASVGMELLEFLKDWLLNHIRVTDHQYVPFVKSMLARQQEQKTAR